MLEDGYSSDDPETDPYEGLEMGSCERGYVDSIAHGDRDVAMAVLEDLDDRIDRIL